MINGFKIIRTTHLKPRKKNKEGIVKHLEKFLQLK